MKWLKELLDSSQLGSVAILLIILGFIIVAGIGSNLGIIPMGLGGFLYGRFLALHILR